MRSDLPFAPFAAALRVGTAMSQYSGTPDWAVDRASRTCIILPAYNEASHLGAVLARIPDWVVGIIIVDDASTDETLTVARSLDDPRVRVVHHESNQGVGGAMRSGYLAALEEDYDIVVKMDADDQMDVAELSRLVWPVSAQMAEYAKGNRFRRNGKPPGMPGARWFGNVMLSLLTKVASGYWHVFDPQCGYTAINAETLRRLKLDGIACDYFFENDMLIRLNVLDARVVDVQTAAIYGRETSHLRVGHISRTFPFRLVRGFFWRFVKRHIVLDFGLIALLSILGLGLTLFGLAFGGYVWWLSASSGTPTNAGTVMIAVVPVILGIQMLLQALAMEVQSSPGAEETRRYSHMASYRPDRAPRRDGSSPPD
jgi:glycosyltransferase involved in cell wall biosynthesis